MRQKKLTTLIKYGMVGAVNTAIDYSVSSLSHFLLGLSADVATPIGYICGVVSSYILNGRFTFRAKGSLPKFLLVNGVSLIISEAVMLLWKPEGTVYALAKAVAIVLTTTVNYVGYRLVVFKKK